MLRSTLLAAVVAAGLVVLPQLAGAATPNALPGGALLSTGARGAQVRILQSDLGLLQDPPGPLDGIFGPRTRACVVEFQQYAGLRADGVVGPLTWREIHSYLKQDFNATSGSLAAVGADYGDVGPAVVQLQLALRASGGNPGPVNGVYDLATRSALFAYEAEHGLRRTTAIAGNLARLLGRGGAQVPARSAARSTTPARSSSATASGVMIDGRPVLDALKLTATAYGPSLQDNYPYGAVDFFGRPLVAGDVAVDPRVIPLHSWLWVTGYSTPFLPAGGFLAHAVDEGHAIKGMRIDLFMNQREANVSSFGIQPVKVYVLGK